MQRTLQLVTLTRIAVFPLVLLFTGPAAAQNGPESRVEWNRPIKPFRIVGNIYYVGAAGVSSFLIVGKSGSILLDGAFSETAPQIESNISALGFRLKDVKYLINSHAHYDHCGGLAELKRKAGATLIASEGDRPTLESGRQIGYGAGQSSYVFPAVHVDRIIHDNETLQLGTLKMVAHLTPGHTRGCTTWTMPVQESGRTYQVVFHCSTTVAGNRLVNNASYPGIVADYQRSFAVFAKLPCDVLLAPHPEFFGMHEKRSAQAVSGNIDAFVDSRELARSNEQSKRDFDEELQRQRLASIKR